jgi:pimeloyl-ACP methyl ester carboxylesterase
MRSPKLLTPKLLTTVAAAALLFAACSSSSKSGAPATTTTTTSIVPAPKALPAFYSFSEPIPTKPGTLIKSERLTLPKIHGTVYRVMYVSTTVNGKPTPVTGLIAVPNGSPPAGDFPVVSWGHGTNGMADACAPSFKPDTSETAGLANILLDKGWVLTASDYQGEGTPGMLPYIAGDSAARNTIDIVRAARNMPAVHASDNYVVWGHSEGGQTAMFTDKIGPTYAPELHMKGVVAGAPPSQFNLIYSFLQTSPFRYYLIMAAGGLNTAYGDAEAPLDQILTPKGRALIPKLDTNCDVNKALGPLDVKSLTTGDPFKNPLWKKLLEASDPEAFTAKSPVPLLIIQGGNDEQIPVASTQLLADHLCGLHQVLQRWVYPGQSHAGVIAPSAGDMTHWIADRFADGPNPDPYKPMGLANIDVRVCA